MTERVEGQVRQGSQEVRDRKVTVSEVYGEALTFALTGGILMEDGRGRREGRIVAAGMHPEKGLVVVGYDRDVNYSHGMAGWEGNRIEIFVGDEFLAIHKLNTPSSSMEFRQRSHMISSESEVSWGSDSQDTHCTGDGANLSTYDAVMKIINETQPDVSVAEFLAQEWGDLKRKVALYDRYFMSDR